MFQLSKQQTIVGHCPHGNGRISASELHHDTDKLVAIQQRKLMKEFLIPIEFVLRLHRSTTTYIFRLASNIWLVTVLLFTIDSSYKIKFLYDRLC